jgi:hypothetical protein
MLILSSSLGRGENSKPLPEIDLFDIMNPSLIFKGVVASAQRFFMNTALLTINSSIYNK